MCGKSLCCGVTGSLLVIVIAAVVSLVVTASFDDNFFPTCRNEDGNEFLCPIPPVQLPHHSLHSKIIVQAQNYIISSLQWILHGTLSYIDSTTLPLSNNTITFDGISEKVTIQRDNHGIPHITAHNLKDGIFAQGYSVASDRLYQMEINRRICSGRLSELFGKKALGTDRFSRTLGFSRISSYNSTVYHEEPLSSPYTSRVDSLEHTKAYVAGINAFIHSKDFKLPSEFTMLGVQALSNFTVEDVLCWMRFNCFIMAKGWSRELSLSIIENSLGTSSDFLLDYSDIFPVNIKPTKKQPPHENIKTGNDPHENTGTSVDVSLDQDLENLSMGFGGSNAFAISGKHTESGKPMLAGDPHLPSIHPSTWYRWNLVIKGSESEEERKFCGASATLIPAFITVRTPDYATAVTLANIDVDDTYIVRFIRSANSRELFYEHEGEVLQAEVITEEIYSKDSVLEEIQIIYTKYGVVISDSLGLHVSENGIVDQKPNDEAYEYKIALRSTGLHPSAMQQWNVDHSVIGFSLNAMLARTMDEYETAASFCVTPPLNFVYADNSGNIGHFVTGRVPKRIDPLVGTAPARSWLKENPWQGFMKWEEMPRYSNPEEGFVVSANHKICEMNPRKNSWSNGFRALRLEQLIKQQIGSHVKFSLDDVQKIQQDHLSLVGLEFQSRFFSIPSVSSRFCNNINSPDDTLLCDALREFQKWDGNVNVNSAGACIYEATFVAVSMELFQPLAGSLAPLCLGLGHQAVINPSTELILTLPTRVLAMLDASGKTGSNLTAHLQPVSSKWVNSAGGIEELLVRCFTRATRWLGNKFVDLHQSNSFNVSEWRWGDIHHVKYSHNLGVISPFIDRVLSPESEANGDSDTVSMSQVVPFKNSLHQKGWGVSYRQVHDMGVNDAGLSILPPGNSGRLAAPGYSSTISDFSNGLLHENTYTMPKGTIGITILPEDP